MFDGGPPSVDGRGRPGLNVTVHRDKPTGPIVATVKTSDDGSSKVDLAPGRYAVEASGAASRTVTVEPGRYVAVTLLLKAK